MESRSVWCREGKVALTPAHELPSLGVTFEERTLAMINRYAQSQIPELRDATYDVYVRAYRRAGLISGDAEEIDVILPATTLPEKPLECELPPGSAAPSPSDSGRHPHEQEPDEH